MQFTEVFKKITTVGDNYASIAKVWLGPKLIVLLYDPRDVELVLSSQVYIDKSNEYRFFQPWLGEGLLISTGTTAEPNDP